MCESVPLKCHKKENRNEARLHQLAYRSAFVRHFSVMVPLKHRELWFIPVQELSTRVLTHIHNKWLLKEMRVNVTYYQTCTCLGHTLPSYSGRRGAPGPQSSGVLVLGESQAKKAQLTHIRSSSDKSFQLANAHGLQRSQT